MIDILASVIRLATVLIGENLVAKWVAAARYWYRSLAALSMQRKAEEQYGLLLSEWGELAEDRQVVRPPVVTAAAALKEKAS